MTAEKMTEANETATAPPEPALTVGAQFGLEPNPAAFPWSQLVDMERAAIGRLRATFWRLLHAADESKHGWRRVACYAAAEEVWAEMQRRGCRGLDGSKRGADYGAVADVW